MGGKLRHRRIGDSKSGFKKAKPVSSRLYSQEELLTAARNGKLTSDMLKQLADSGKTRPLIALAVNNHRKDAIAALAGNEAALMEIATHAGWSSDRWHAIGELRKMIRTLTDMESLLAALIIPYENVSSALDDKELATMLAALNKPDTERITSRIMGYARVTTDWRVADVLQNLAMFSPHGSVRRKAVNKLTAIAKSERMNVFHCLSMVALCDFKDTRLQAIRAMGEMPNIFSFSRYVVYGHEERRSERSFFIMNAHNDVKMAAAEVIWKWLKGRKPSENQELDFLTCYRAVVMYHENTEVRRIAFEELEKIGRGISLFDNQWQQIYDAIKSGAIFEDIKDLATRKLTMLKEQKSHEANSEVLRALI